MMIYIESDNKGELMKKIIVYLNVIIASLLTLSLPTRAQASTEDLNLISFEENDEGFVPRGDSELLERTSEDAYAGDYSLKVSERSQGWNGPSIQIEDHVELSTTYSFSVWVKLAEEMTVDLMLSTQIGDGDNASYQVIDTQAVTGDEWVKLEGDYRYDAVVDDFISVYIESSDPHVSYFIDDFSMTTSSEESDAVSVQTELMPIKDVYEDYFLIGNAVSMTEMQGQRLELLTHHHNLVTAENAMKPEYAYDSNREFNFDDQQRLVNRIQEEGLLLHGHVLVWHQQSPEWLHTEDGQLLPRDEALANMERHIEETILQYGDNVIAWEVVNEAMNDNPIDPEMWRMMLRRSDWYDAIGDDYLELAYRKAREVLDENGWHDVKLYYNDYNDDNQSKATAIYHMVKEINESYAEEFPGEKLIDGIGMQGHYNLGTNVDNVRQSIERFMELDVEIGVTELDVTVNTTGELTEEDEIAQGIIYAELFSLYKEYADVISRVTFWGLNDSTSWRSERSPLIFDGDLQAKMAYEAVIDPEGFLARYDSELEEVETRTAELRYGTPVFGESVDDIWETSDSIPLDRYQLAWQGASGIGKVLWDEDRLYILIEVEDSDIDTSSEFEWEQDSVEVFVKENRGDSSVYEEGDGHYRVNAEGIQSFGDTTANTDIETLVTQNASGYTVQMSIPWQTMTPEEGQQIGFDLQINDASSGNRESVSIWNDLSGQGYQDTTLFGELELVRAEEEEASLLEIDNEENRMNRTVLIGIILAILAAIGIGFYIIYNRTNESKKQNQ